MNLHKDINLQEWESDFCFLSTPQEQTPLHHLFSTGPVRFPDGACVGLKCHIYKPYLQGVRGSEPQPRQADISVVSLG